MRPARLALLAVLLGLAGSVPALAQDQSLPHPRWSFSGMFGTYDRAAAQRGLQVYLEVCSTCHSLNLGYYRDLSGIGLSADQIKAVAAGVTLPTIGDDGQPTERPGVPQDRFKRPFANELAARAALNGALPPDLTDIVKAREGGADYIYGILTGFSDPPAGMKLGDGMNYNTYFPGHQIAMPQPLHDAQVTYADATKASIEQEAHDVVTFLAYMANPELEQRHRIGVQMVLFFLLLTGLTYAVKRKLWADVH
jgi:ubiquinol-cytochrome c reductase cytochrome c1 subunit